MKTQNMCYFVGNSGHLLVPELIIKGEEGLNLANFEELFIGTVNWQKQNVGAVNWISQQFVIHGQGAKIANVPGLTSCNLQSCNFCQLANLQECFSGGMQAWLETYKKSLFFGGLGFSRAKIFQVSHNAMRRQEGYRKDSANWIVGRSFCEWKNKTKHKLQGSGAGVLLIFTDFRVVLETL